MLHHIPKEKVYTSDHGWLTSRFLFSFADYYDPKNMEWGKLRVFNDDTIAPHSGFPHHPHRDAEIVTILHKGTLTHEDSMGNKQTLVAPCVQRMSAGSGVVHSEMNNGDETIELYQLWFYPKESNLKPSYEERQMNYSGSEEVLVSSDEEDDAVRIQTNATIIRSTIVAGESTSFELAKEAYALLYIRSGEVHVGDIIAGERDQIRIHQEEMIFITATADTECYLVVTWQ